ncbi:hypothetical protein TNCV_4200341 [Trichonephila clavipes]|uniref:Uncharacterized protein n=1 Tax=Trichonephila clavipes TaxID=2585209 RepID=A0A8X7BHR0_TRICX|nr:hypothetical protein TNCV_4200341 [Trichonephila clavipes]
MQTLSSATRVIISGTLATHDRGRRRRLFPEGWEKKMNHDVKVEQIKKTPTRNGEGGRAQKHERSNETERRRGKGRTQEGRRDGRRL